ncbi:hypothetical protein [Candidatus Endomicrobiellum agilis]
MEKRFRCDIYFKNMILNQFELHLPLKTKQCPLRKKRMSHLRN